MSILPMVPAFDNSSIVKQSASTPPNSLMTNRLSTKNIYMKKKYKIKYNAMLPTRNMLIDSID